MSDNKKYYYLKLKENFYNTEDIKLLESMPNGYEYSSLYLKLCLLSIKGEGQLLYKNRIPYKPEMLSTITGHKREVIEYAIPLLKELEMLTIQDNGTIFIDDIQSLVGHGSTEAERKIEYRRKLKEIKQLGQCPTNRPPELELRQNKTNKINIDDEKEKPSDENTSSGSSEKTELKPFDEFIAGEVNKLYSFLKENHPARNEIYPGDLSKKDRTSWERALKGVVSKYKWPVVEQALHYMVQSDYWLSVFTNPHQLKYQIPKVVTEMKNKKVFQEVVE